MMRRPAVIVAVLALISSLIPVAYGQESAAPDYRLADYYSQRSYIDPTAQTEVLGKPIPSDVEMAQYREAILQAEEDGTPEPELRQGEMWSDSINLPDGISKTEADNSEILLGKQAMEVELTRSAADNCKMYWLVPKVCGAILDRYQQLGELTSWLGYPTEMEVLNADGVGYSQRFAGGYIFWHPILGAHAVSNLIAPVWERNGLERGL